MLDFDPRDFDSHVGNQAVATLEKSSEILRFKAAYREGRTIATVNRALGTLSDLDRREGGWRALPAFAPRGATARHTHTRQSRRSGGKKVVF